MFSSSFSALQKFYGTRGIRHLTGLRNPVIYSRFRGARYGLKFLCKMGIHEKTKMLTCDAQFPLLVPQHKLVVLSELILRTNVRLKSGRFDLNFAQGVISFHADSLLCSQEVVEETAGRLTALAAMACDFLTPAVRLCLDTDTLPVDALKTAFFEKTNIRIDKNLSA